MQAYQQEHYFNDPRYKSINDAYSLCFLGLFLSYLTIIAAFVLALIKRRSYQGSHLRSHADYILCGCLYYTLFILLSIGIIYWNYQQSFFSRGNLLLGGGLYVFFALFPFVWWIRRFTRGLDYLKRGLAIPAPFSPWRPRK